MGLDRKDHKTMGTIKNDMTERLGENKWIPIILPPSSKNNGSCRRIELAVKVYENKTRRVTTSRMM
jgi:GTP-binding protein